MIKTDGRFTWKVKITKERYGSSNSPVIGIGGGENGEVEIKEIKTTDSLHIHFHIEEPIEF